MANGGCYVINAKLANTIRVIAENPGLGTVAMARILGISRESYVNYVRDLSYHGMVDTICEDCRYRYRITDKGRTALDLIERFERIAPAGVTG